MELLQIHKWHLKTGIPTIINKQWLKYKLQKTTMLLKKLRLKDQELLQRQEPLNLNLVNFTGRATEDKVKKKAPIKGLYFYFLSMIEVISGLK